MNVELVGSGPAAESVAAALADTDAELGSDAPDLTVAVGPVGDLDIGHADRVITVELGGVGGHPVSGVDAAVSGVSPETGCFDCLRTRVEANAEATDDGAFSPADARLAGAIAGREAARVVAGEESIFGRVIELPHAERDLFPVPGCACGTAPDRTLDRSHEERPLDEAIGRAERAVDPRVGLIHELGEAESFPAPYYLATLAATTGFSDQQAPQQAAGVAANWNGAYMKGLGEALERYSAGVYRASEFHRAPASMVPNAVSPAAFVLSPEFDAPDDSEPINWVPGERLDTGAEAMLPAEFVAFPPPTHRHRPAITTGLGLGSSGVDALLSGLYEVVERDAAMLAWYSSFEPLGLAVEDEGFEELAKRARSEDLSVTTLLLTQDLDVPVVAACVHREGAWPAFAAGMSANLDPVAAARGALEEAVQNWMELRGMGKQGATEESGAIGHFASFPRTAKEFVSPETTIPADSLGEGAVAGEAELETLTDRVTAAGLTPYGVRTTPRDVEALGFEAVRVLVPEAQPLFTDTPYFGERAETVPEKLGFEPRLNREHHPYP
ncbi:YcaO-like family protein [Natronomonas sp. EA1]|uniref:YcaO-like family protein n=1 Tax=Natronomonas sp. EA1 TaxID=3421655 RepID=UPI003EBC8AB1